LARLAFAGITAPIIFTVLVIVQGMIQPEYSHVVMPISALAVWPWGWIQTANFYTCGLLMMAYAAGLHFGIRPTPAGLVGPAILTLSGVGLVLAGVFPMIRDAAGTIVEPPGHAVAAILTFLDAGVGLAVISRRMSRDPVWQSLATYALASGIAILALFVVMAAFAVPEDGPVHAWFGLLQRVVLAVWFPCTIVLAVRLLGVANG